MLSRSAPAGFVKSPGPIAILAVTLAAGGVLAASTNRVPTGAGFAITLFTVAGLGFWTGRGRRAAAFWRGAGAAFAAVATAGLISALTLYRSSSFDQPAVLPPPAVFSIGVVGVALIGGFVGGMCAWLARHKA